MTQEPDAPKAEADPAPATDEMARLRENAAKYGAAYAAFGEAFQTRAMTLLARGTWWFILASAVGVVVLAILSKLD